MHSDAFSLFGKVKSFVAYIVSKRGIGPYTIGTACFLPHFEMKRAAVLFSFPKGEKVIVIPIKSIKDDMVILY